MSLLLLRATVATAICVISHGAVSTKGHNNDFPISPTSLAESGTSLHKYLLTSSALKRWHPWIDLTNICYFCGRHSLLFFLHLRKRETHLLISPTRSPNLEEAMSKSFIQTSILYNTMESPHQPGYNGLAGWLHIAIEPDANREYSRIVRLVSPWFVS
jgi:hypothetical protein